MSTKNSHTKLARSGRFRLATLGATIPLFAIASVLAPSALAVASANATAPDSPASVSTGVAFHRNGSGYVPVPGDVVVEGGASYGHVSVVDSVKHGKIVTVEENASPSGWHTYSWSGKKASGAYSGREVTGFVHSPKNKNTNR